MAVALLVVGALGLAGCVPADRLPTIPPTPSGEPVFESEEEALAAAEDAYAAYLEMSDLIASEGGINPERIGDFAVGDLYESALEGFATFAENGWKSVGRTSITAVSLQFADIEANAGPEVVGIYLCVDVSGVDVLDEGGESVVSPSRPNLQAFEVAFDLVEGDLLIPSSRIPWDSAGICG